MDTGIIVKNVASSGKRITMMRIKNDLAGFVIVVKTMLISLSGIQHMDTIVRIEKNKY